jgi:hypothetical protein
MFRWTTDRGRVVSHHFAGQAKGEIMKFRIALCALALALPAIAQAQNAIPVTADNFNRAETDMYFAGAAKRGALGKFFHYRELPVESSVVRPNRDTLYSEAVFDLDAGPVKITMPNPGKRFMSGSRHPLSVHRVADIG